MLAIIVQKIQLLETIQTKAAIKTALTCGRRWAPPESLRRLWTEFYHFFRHRLKLGVRQISFRQLTFPLYGQLEWLW